MIVKKYGKNYLAYDEYSYIHKKELRDFIEKKVKIFFSFVKEEIILVLGGDGTMLAAISTLHEKNIPFLGINFGLEGFLMHDKKYVSDKCLYKKREYPLLSVQANLGEESYESVAFNEVNITVADGKVLDLEVCIGENTSVFRGDGTLISTPAGSTGYNKSLYGPILPHETPSFILTPKAEMSHKKAVIFPNTQEVRVQNIHRFNPLEVYLDSRKLGETQPGEKVDIVIKKSEQTIKFIILEDYQKIWDNKVFSAQDFHR